MRSCSEDRRLGGDEAPADGGPQHGTISRGLEIPALHGAGDESENLVGQVVKNDLFLGLQGPHPTGPKQNVHNDPPPGVRAERTRQCEYAERYATTGAERSRPSGSFVSGEGYLCTFTNSEVEDRVYDHSWLLFYHYLLPWVPRQVKRAWPRGQT